MSTTQSERRLKSRVVIEGKIDYRIENSNELHEGELEDMSSTGARIWVQQVLEPASRLICRIHPEDSQETAIEISATLLHSHPQRRGSLYGYGCTIEEVNPG